MPGATSHNILSRLLRREPLPPAPLLNAPPAPPPRRLRRHSLCTPRPSRFHGYATEIRLPEPVEQPEIVVLPPPSMPTNSSQRRRRDTITTANTRANAMPHTYYPLRPSPHADERSLYPEPYPYPPHGYYSDSPHEHHRQHAPAPAHYATSPAAPGYIPSPTTPAYPQPQPAMAPGTNAYHGPARVRARPGHPPGTPGGSVWPPSPGLAEAERVYGTPFGAAHPSPFGSAHASPYSAHPSPYAPARTSPPAPAYSSPHASAHGTPHLPVYGTPLPPYISTPALASTPLLPTWTPPAAHAHPAVMLTSVPPTPLHHPTGALMTGGQRLQLAAGNPAPGSALFAGPEGAHWPPEKGEVGRGEVALMPLLCPNPNDPDRPPLQWDITCDAGTGVHRVSPRGALVELKADGDAWGAPAAWAGGRACRRIRVEVCAGSDGAVLGRFDVGEDGDDDEEDEKKGVKVSEVCYALNDWASQRGWGKLVGSRERAWWGAWVGYGEGRTWVMRVGLVDL